MEHLRRKVVSFFIEQEQVSFFHQTNFKNEVSTMSPYDSIPLTSLSLPSPWHKIRVLTFAIPP